MTVALAYGNVVLIRASLWTLSILTPSESDDAAGVLREELYD